MFTPSSARALNMPAATPEWDRHAYSDHGDLSDILVGDDSRGLEGSLAARLHDLHGFFKLGFINREGNVRMNGPFSPIFLNDHVPR